MHHVRTIGRMPNASSDSGIPRPDGLVLAPFRALRYSPDRVDWTKVRPPPYDVIDDSERAALEQRDPANVVRFTLPQDDTGPDSRYAAAARRLAEWRAGGLLVADA